ncbi:MAG: 4Fe-4S binding protein [Actinobacteria bacterium]|nr:4Fe-4S binding protein [Actinomycetota bacterium]
MNLFKNFAPANLMVKRKIPFMRGNKRAKFIFDNTFSPVFSLARLPHMVEIVPWFRRDKTDLRSLPLNKDIDLPDGAPLPTDLLFRFIEEASHRTITEDGCMCRIACGCKEYPEDIGCLFLGDSAVEISEKINREVTVEEAKEHARRAIDAGLVPMIGKVRFDNLIYMIRDRSRLVTICFCCECCCVSRHLREMRIDDFEQVYPRLDGITVEVTGDCTGCGNCADQCYMKAISISSGKAEIGEYCRACGRCASVCPENAIKIEINDPEYLEKAYERIRSYVRHD